MNSFFADGHAIEMVMTVLLVEALVLVTLRRRGAAAPGWSEAAPMWLSGMLLLLAWRLSIAAVPWFFVAATLLAAGLTHSWDLLQRWPRGIESPPPPAVSGTRETTGTAKAES